MLFKNKMIRISLLKGAWKYLTSEVTQGHCTFLEQQRMFFPLARAQTSGACDPGNKKQKHLGKTRQPAANKYPEFWRHLGGGNNLLLMETTNANVPMPTFESSVTFSCNPQNGRHPLAEKATTSPPHSSFPPGFANTSRRVALRWRSPVLRDRMWRRCEAVADTPPPLSVWPC